MTERWRVLDDRLTNPFTGEPERHICKSRADDATVIAVEGPHCDDDARWVAAALNAVDGVPTEVLDAGVVVVAVEVARLIGKALATCSYRDLVTYGGLSEQEYEQLQTIASLLQQNGGEGR